MSTILAGKRPTEQRAQDAGSGLLAAAFERHADALLAYIGGHNDLPAATDSYGVEDLASEVWAEIAKNLDLVDERVTVLSYLRLIANKVVREAAKVEIVEVPVGFAGGELELAADGSEFGADEDYAMAPLEPVETLPTRLIVGAPRTGMGSRLGQYLLGEGVSV